MNEEVLLFNTFNHLMQTRTKAMRGLQKASQPNEEDDPREADSCLANEIVLEIESLKTDPKKAGNLEKIGVPQGIQGSENTKESKQADGSEKTKGSKQRLQEYREYTMDTEIPDEDEIQGRGKGPKNKVETEVQRLTKLFEKFGRFFVLDITREISLLRQIKDIQDELEMMGKVFAEQKEVIEALDRIIRSMLQSNDPNNDKQTETSSSTSNLRRSHNNFKRVEDFAESTHSLYKESKWSSMVEWDITDDPWGAFGDEPVFAHEQHGYLDKETQKSKDFLKQSQSMIWQFRHQKENLPLRTVNRFAEQIKTMNERARNTKKAVCQPLTPPSLYYHCYFY